MRLDGRKFQGPTGTLVKLDYFSSQGERTVRRLAVICSVFDRLGACNEETIQ